MSTISKEMYQSSDKERNKKYPEKLSILLPETYRSPFRIDYARLIHCTSFRRLANKTQLFPTGISDFFRTRLTHSLEVSQIAKSIAIKINEEEIGEQKSFLIDTDIVEFASLAHDLGHPPFGHIGEKVLDFLMRKYGGFEGNAQTLRLLTKTEKKFLDENNKIMIYKQRDQRIGLNLTYRSLASILKYDNIIPFTQKDRVFNNSAFNPIKGYYKTEKSIVSDIKKHVLKDYNEKGKLKTIECQIMDVADDIAYSTFDLEDAFKAGFLDPFSIIYSSNDIIKNVVRKVNSSLGENLNEEDVRTVILNLFKFFFDKEQIEGLLISKFGRSEYNELKQDTERYTKVYSQMVSNFSYNSSRKIAENGYLRIDFTSQLVGKFIRAIKFELNKDCPALSKVYLEKDIRMEVEILKKLIFETQINSPKFRAEEYSGEEIISKIFNVLNDDKRKNYRLLPLDFKHVYKLLDGLDRERTICDFISSMTDTYAMEFYDRLFQRKSRSFFGPQMSMSLSSD